MCYLEEVYSKFYCFETIDTRFTLSRKLKGLIVLSVPTAHHSANFYQLKHIAAPNHAALSISTCV